MVAGKEEQIEHHGLYTTLVIFQTQTSNSTLFSALASLLGPCFGLQGFRPKGGILSYHVLEEENILYSKVT